MNTPLPNLRLHWIDGTIIIAYLLVLLGVGFYHARRSRGQRDFFLAGREIKWLAIGFSLMAALNSGIDYLMQPAAMIKFGVYTMVGSLSWLVIYPYVFHIALPLYRRLNSISVYEYLENRFDGRVRALAASIFVLWRFGWMATALYVPSLAISVATGGRISVTVMAVTLGTVVTLYTMMGGIRAVVWNDVSNSASCSSVWPSRSSSVCARSTAASARSSDSFPRWARPCKTRCRPASAAPFPFSMSR